MDTDEVRLAYRRWAPVYDVLFGSVARIGRLRTVQAVNMLGANRILEVGVGTGLSLSRYSRDSQITGIDLSEDMLAVARKRVASRQLSNVTLRCMDAEAMDLPDSSFDVVVAMHVLSVIPNPERALAEMRRVCKTDGVIMICNHIVDGSCRQGIARWLAPFAKWLGWHPDFSLAQVPGVDQLDVIRAEQVPPLFTVIQCLNRQSQGLQAAE